MISRASRPAGDGRSVRRITAFTLVELLLVVAIIGVMAAVTVPSFVRSMRGNRLRAAARTVISANRYARSMAIIRQREVLLRLDLDGAVVSVGDLEAAAMAATEAAMTGRVDLAADELPVVPAGPRAATAETAGGGGLPGLTRQLDGVDIESVDRVGGDGKRMRGTVAIRYRSNGICDAYTITLRDTDDDTLRVMVDALGTAETDGGVRR